MGEGYNMASVSVSFVLDRRCAKPLGRIPPMQSVCRHDLDRSGSRLRERLLLNHIQTCSVDSLESLAS